MTDLSMALGVGCCGSDCDCCGGSCAAETQDFTGLEVGHHVDFLDTGQPWVFGDADTAGVIANVGGTHMMVPGGASVFPVLGVALPDCCTVDAISYEVTMAAQTGVIGIGAFPFPFGDPGATGWVIGSNGSVFTVNDWQLNAYGPLPFVWDASPHLIRVNWSLGLVEMFVDNASIGVLDVGASNGPEPGLLAWVIGAGTQLADITVGCGTIIPPPTVSAYANQAGDRYTNQSGDLYVPS